MKNKNLGGSLIEVALIILAIYFAFTIISMTQASNDENCRVRPQDCITIVLPK